MALPHSESTSPVFMEFPLSLVAIATTPMVLVSDPHCQARKQLEPPFWETHRMPLLAGPHKTAELRKLATVAKKQTRIKEPLKI